VAHRAASVLFVALDISTTPESPVVEGVQYDV
jgi:hypothetical protein